MKIYATLFAILAVTAGSAGAAVAPATWNSYSPTEATGQLDGVNIRMTSSHTSPLVGITNNRFATTGSWDAGSDSALGPAAMSVIASKVNGGDFQRFYFDAPTEGTLYIENFDSGSVADIVAIGATSLELFDNSSSISFNSYAANGGELSTSNAGFDGEGDAVFRFFGAVTEIYVHYTQGTGDNGVFYTFSTPQPVPEPSSMIVMGGLFGLMGTVYYRRRRQA